jgi:hypothetical protein
LTGLASAAGVVGHHHAPCALLDRH